MFPDRLLAGYRAFLDERLPRERARFEALAERGQSPEIMVIGCCDSRVSPEVIFDASPGELFVVRNVANLVPPYETQGQYHGTSAALEFAVQALRVKHIVVLGHARCGGIRAFADDAAPLSPGDFIGRWMDLIAPAARRLGAADGDREDYLTRLELATIEHGLAQPHDLPLRAHPRRARQAPPARRLFRRRDRCAPPARPGDRRVRPGRGRAAAALSLRTPLPNGRGQG